MGGNNRGKLSEHYREMEQATLKSILSDQGNMVKRVKRSQAED